MPADDDDLPELATNAEWRGIMVRARKAYGITQQQLADKFHVSQAIISKIESGETASSKLVLPICETLSIPQPVHMTDPDELHWMQLGRVLRAKAPDQARAALRLIETLAETLDAKGVSESDPAQQQKPRK